MRLAMDTPIRFTPFLREKEWGGRRLGRELGKRLDSDKPFGESWEISDHPVHRSQVTTGPWSERSLRELMERERRKLLGSAAAEHEVFPWLIKFLDAADWLSVQVHPDPESVRHLSPGEGSKTEAWFVMAADPGSRIYAGLLPGVDEVSLRSALRENKVAQCLHQFEPHPGDCVFLPAGTVHAVGGGVLMAEVQQTSDATYRLFDWDRRDEGGRARELHIEQALASIHWAQGPVQPVRAFASNLSGGPSHESKVLVQCPYFDLQYRRESESFVCGGAGRLQTVVVLQGQGRWVTLRGDEPLRGGEAWLLPASLPTTSCRVEDELEFLLCTLP
jgi:mannose-6-phosphate isomerase